MNIKELEETIDAICLEPERTFAALGREKSFSLLKEICEARPDLEPMLKESEFAMLVQSDRKTVIASIFFEEEKEDE